MKQYDILFLPSGRRGQIDEGTTIREAAQLIGQGIESIAGNVKSGFLKVANTASFQRLTTYLP